MANDSVSSSQRSALKDEVEHRAKLLAIARVKFATEFLLAKAQRREGNPISDKTAEMMATVSTNSDETLREAQYLTALSALEWNDSDNTES